jgi:hypothetical protein
MIGPYVRASGIVSLFNNELLHSRTEIRYVWSLFPPAPQKIALDEARYGGFECVRDTIRNTVYTQKKLQRQLATRNKTFIIARQIKK